MRRPLKKKHELRTDVKYSSLKVAKLINFMMKEGKKSTAREVVYNALDEVKKMAKVEDPIEVFDLAMKNVAPLVEVRSKRVGGANYQVPREVRPERRTFLGMNWILEAARNKKGKPMHIKLAEEIMLASKEEGDAVRKRENTHKMAEANKAFAHFAW